MSAIAHLVFLIPYKYTTKIIICVMFVQIIGNKPVRPQGLSEKATNFVVESSLPVPNEILNSDSTVSIFVCQNPGGYIL